MPRYRHIHTNFRGGEISPNSHGTTDTELYNNSVKEMTNYMVKPQGGAVRRPGSSFVAKEFIKAKLSDGTAINGGVAEGYTLPFGTAMIPFNTPDGAYVVILEANGVNSSIVIVSEDTGAEQTFTVNTALYSLSFSTFVNFTSVADIQYTQNGDVLVITTKQQTLGDPSTTTEAGIQPIIIRKTSSSAFERVDVINTVPLLPRGREYPFKLVNTEATTLAYTSPTVTAALGSPFRPSDPGSILKILKGGKTYYLVITAYTSATQVTVAELGDGNGPATSPSPITATTVWEKSAFGGQEGWPNSCTFHEQRLLYGKGETIYGSQLGDIFEFDAVGAADDTGYGTVTSSDPFSVVPASTEINTIKWLAGGKSLIIGTSGGEFVATGSQGVFSATEPYVTPQTSYGSQGPQPIRIDSALYFISRSFSKLRQFLFNESEDNYKAVDLSTYTEHFLNKRTDDPARAATITRIAKQQSFTTFTWMVDGYGGLYVASIDAALGVNAWSFQQMAGSSGAAGSVNTRVYDVVSVQNSGQSAGDNVWLFMERYIDGSVEYYFEKITNNTNLTNCVDSAVTGDLSGAPSATISGLDHLEGETVAVILKTQGNSKDYYAGEFTVSGGSLTLDTIYNNDYTVGLHFDSTLTLLPNNQGSAIGTSQAAISRFDEIHVRFTNSYGCSFASVGVDEEYEFDFNDPTLTPQQGTPLYTGDKKEDLPSTYDRRGEVTVKQTIPMPQEITAIVLRGVVYD